MPSKLPVYNPEAICPKCHYDKIRVRYCAHSLYSDACHYPGPFYGISHFHRMCENCNYEWLEKTLDQKEADDAR